ncbi:universal stress protein [Devosia sp. ZB163]|uniref:universal stress protein n=1 Tax=Devosia sp. ZB163 TaxID=3025938 RepID=UPI00236212F3|nr:universal stress protein [Devosia sp. ZB163]MDC9822492.1 universal stress protein [Devosia sp. ZB163]
MNEYKRKFLVVVDESKETDRAITFAAHRVNRTGGTVLLLSVIDSQDFTQFLGVEDVMRAEAREEAERLLDAKRARIDQIGEGVRTETVIREGDLVTEIEGLIRQDPGIAILVLAASAAKEGPGPLVGAFAGRAGQAALPVIITIIPGSMTDEQIVAVT